MSAAGIFSTSEAESTIKPESRPWFSTTRMRFLRLRGDFLLAKTLAQVHDRNDLAAEVDHAFHVTRAHPALQ